MYIGVIINISIRSTLLAKQELPSNLVKADKNKCILTQTNSEMKHESGLET